jgi:Pyruvate/2-oxoacid:ferredoxin oxidoreductase delta subunit/predicted transcriptional regulator
MGNQTDAYTELAERHGFGGSARYRRLMEMMMSPLQARLVTMLPSPFEEVAQKANLDVDTVKQELEDLFLKGVIIPKNFHTREGYRFCRSVEQFHDATLTNRVLEGAQAAEFYDLWNQFCHQEWYAHYAQEYADREQPRERVVPAYNAIKDIPGILPHENVREILKFNELIATTPCTCRRREGNCAKPLDVCLQFGRAAEYAIVRGSGWKLSYEEAVALADKVEDSGLVHIWKNSADMVSNFMCNCCDDCCVAWVPLTEHHVSVEKRSAKSRFEARVDQELCDGCQVCIDRCQYDAIEMQKVPGSKRLKAAVDPEKCFGCGVCVLKCEPQALSMKMVRPPEHIPAAAQA